MAKKSLCKIVVRTAAGSRRGMKKGGGSDSSSGGSELLDWVQFVTCWHPQIPLLELSNSMWTA